MKKIFKKIGLIFALCCVFAISIINYALPVKADSISELNGIFYNDEYFVLSISKYDYDAYYNPNPMHLFEINIPHYYGGIDGSEGQYHIYNVKLDFNVQKYTENGHRFRINCEYSAPPSGLTEGVFKTTTIYLDQDLNNYFLFAYNNYNETNQQHLLYYGAFEVGLDMVKELISSYFDFSDGDAMSIKLGYRQIVLNDYYTGESIDGLFVSLDQYYSYSPFKVIAHNNKLEGENIGLNTNISNNWISSALGVISSILEIQILPGVSLGVIVGIPLIFGLLKIILALWRNNG